MRRPSPLQVVAWLFFASGLSAAVSIAGALLFEGRINLDINVIGLWICPGLLRYEARYRAWAMRLLILDFCTLPIAMLLVLLQTRPIEMKVFGRSAGTVSPSIVLAILAVISAGAVWQYWVLSRAHVRALFTIRPAEVPEPSV